ncbi:vWA domain-containing protein [Chondromyces crocatus]|uniref:vWA domain-containing protein n=1 Tax=Chondromyces crocatus TaxID=52 RepID=UPI001FDEA994|nr:VWA domain-containing protein [Chondromyces crocatus]
MNNLPRKGICHVLLAALLALTGLGCGGGLRVTRINSAEKKPNNVWVFFTVEEGDEPVGGLTADKFKIYEDGELVSEFESKQTIQNPEVAAVMYTMLLVDMSGSITESGQADALVDAAQSFSERVGKQQKVGVYAFDGEAKIHSVVPFTEAQGSVKGGLEGLRRYKPKDPSTNLHGAVVEGLKELKKELDKDKRPLKFGTLVVFSDGTDRARRVPRNVMRDEMAKSDYDNYEMFAVGVGAEIEKARLDEIGRDGTELVSDQAKVQDAFNKIAAKIEAHMKRFYLLSYCTPSRAGEHEVEIVAERTEPKASGSLEYKFSAEGFGPPPECNPDTPPTFDLKDTRPQGSDDKGGGPGVKASGSVKVNK